MRIPSLDGLRGVSIVVVLIAHVVGTRNAPDAAWLRAIGDFGGLGVRTFFVMSGYLMTLLLEGEFDRTGRISVAGFLRRRAFRIVPAFAGYVATLAVLGAAGVVTLHPGDLLMSMTFSMNYAAQRSWYVGHLWSLSVEAQFYVVWALLRVAAGRSGMRWVTGAALIAGPAARVALHVFAPQWRWAITEAFPTVVDALAAGGLLAMAQGTLMRHQGYVRLLRSKLMWGAPLALIVLNANMPHVAFSYPIGETLTNLLIAISIHRVVAVPQSFAGRFLNTSAVAGLGAMSYSLYLWQQPFLNRGSASVLSAFPLNLVLACGAALVSYHLVEGPALRLAQRLRTVGRAATTRPASGGLHPHAAVN